MCCGKSRLEALETKETLLFNVDKLDRLYPIEFPKIWEEYSILFYSILKKMFIFLFYQI